MFVSVDYGSFETSRSFAGQFINLKSKILYLGGAYRLMLLPGTKATQNFHGCLKGVSIYLYYQAASALSHK